VVYVLIVLGLAVVIAPLMSAMPSKSQRAKAALRDQARACNLRVSLRPLPPIPARFRFASDDEFACYESRLSLHLHLAGRDERFVSVDGEWSPTMGVSNAPEWLSALPSGAAFVELSEQTVSIFWNEKEGLDGLNTLSQAIDSIE
jgi:hypothetical protein